MVVYEKPTASVGVIRSYICTFFLIEIGVRCREPVSHSNASASLFGILEISKFCFRCRSGSLKFLELSQISLAFDQSSMTPKVLQNPRELGPEALPCGMKKLSPH
jgi:hypothetical protein